MNTSLAPYIENPEAIYVHNGGNIPAPEEPELGVTLDEDTLEDYRLNSADI
ncbi:hypothetical protein [Haladaptatus halobius]|uniref:hypothetical protein n=1 Tax=Haladaptatus halobius TaxID=2884875 RepID=UPI001D0A1899|nr:hypothetical protein [Haladaptatus halobius]